MQSLQLSYQMVNVDDLIDGYKLYFNSKYKDSMNFFETKKQNDIRYFFGYARAYLAQYQINSIPPYDQINNLVSQLFHSILKLCNINNYQKIEQIKFQEHYLKLSQNDQILVDWCLLQFIQINFLTYHSNFKNLLPSVLQLMRDHFSNVKHIYADWGLKYLSSTSQEIPHKLQQNEVKITKGLDMDNIWIIITEAKILSQKNSSTEKDKISTFIQFAQNMFPKCDLVHLFQGDYCVTNSLFQLSRNHYAQCIKLNKENYIAICNKGYSYEYDYSYNETNKMTDRFNKAIEHYQKAISICPTYWVLYNNIGVCYKNLEEKQLAAEFFIQSVEVNHTYANGSAKILEQLPFVSNSPNIEQYIIRLHILADQQPNLFKKVLIIFQKNKPFILQKMIQRGIQKFPFQTYAILNNKKKNEEFPKIIPIINLAKDEFQFIAMIAAYKKNIKQFFQYQASHFYWDLFID